MSIFDSGGGLLVTTDRWPLTYPAWFSALDRRRIDDALSAAAASATLPASRATAPTRVVTGPVHGHLFASEVTAIEAVLQVFAVVVRVLSTPRDGADDSTRRRVADYLFDELIVWIADLTPAVTTCDPFADRVRDARETCSWWTEAFAAPASTVSVQIPPAAQLDDDSPLLTLQEAAAKLRLSTKTLKEIGAKGELDIIRVSERKLRVRQAEVNRLLALNKYRFR